MFEHMTHILYLEFLADPKRKPEKNIVFHYWKCFVREISNIKCRKGPNRTFYLPFPRQSGLYNRSVPGFMPEQRLSVPFIMKDQNTLFQATEYNTQMTQILEFFRRLNT